MAAEISPKVTVREGLWADEVARANAIAGVSLAERVHGYTFSNGRTFDDAKGAYDKAPE